MGSTQKAVQHPRGENVHYNAIVTENTSELSQLGTFGRPISNFAPSPDDVECALVEPARPISYLILRR
jgi:hypothetical protein